VQGDDDRAGARGEGGPCAEPEVGVYDVEGLVAVTPAERERGSRIPAEPGREGEELDLDIAAPAQCLDLVPDERADRRALGGRVEVGDDQDAHELSRGCRTSVTNRSRGVAP